MVKVAVVGVMDSVGREILTFLDEAGYKKTEVIAVENKAPMGTQVSYGEDYELDVHNLDDFDFSKVDVAIFATSSEISKRYVPQAMAKKIKIIDCSNAFFSNQDVPLVIAGMNDYKLDDEALRLVSIPSPATLQALLPLKDIDRNYKIKRIVSSSYTSTSYHGREGMDELFSQTKKIYSNNTLRDDESVFKKQIAFNVIPQVGEFIGDETLAEWQMNAEAKKILGTDVKVHANCAFVPAFIGIAQFVNVECEKDIDVDDVRDLMSKTKGVVVFDKNVDGGYFCLTDVQGESSVYVSRLRQDVSVENGISFWVVADNLRVGIAKNAYEVMKAFFRKK